MTTIVCTPDYYPAVFVVLGFLVAVVFMSLGRYVRGSEMAGKTTIDRRNMVKRADRINYLKSLRAGKHKKKTAKVLQKV